MQQQGRALLAMQQQGSNAVEHLKMHRTVLSIPNKEECHLRGQQSMVKSYPKIAHQHLEANMSVLMTLDLSTSTTDDVLWLPHSYAHTREHSSAHTTKTFV